MNIGETKAALYCTTFATLFLLERQNGFELVALDRDGAEDVVTEVEWTGNRYAKRPPTIRFGPDIVSFSTLTSIWVTSTPLTFF
jgi:hypothetical protein